MRRIPDYERTNNYPLQKWSPIDKALREIPSQLVIDEFWKEVDRYSSHGPNGDCWVFLDCNGDPVFRSFFRYTVQTSNGKTISLTRAAHRFSYLIDRGFIPELENISWTCNNIACVNPSHLFSANDDYVFANVKKWESTLALVYHEL